MSKPFRGIVWGDLQAHPWQEAERRHGVAWIHQVISDVYYEANAYDADAIFFLGDLFESKRSVRSDIVTIVYADIINNIMHNPGMQHIFVTGNHDLSREHSTLVPFDFLDNVQVATSDYTIGVKSRGFVSHWFEFLPFASKNSCVHTGLRRPMITMSHVPIHGAEYGAGLQERSGLGLDTFHKKTNRLIVFAGHYHRHQVIRRADCADVVIVGAPLQHNWGDMDDDIPRGIIKFEWDLDTGITWEHVPLNYPRFWSKRSASDKQVDTDFYLPETSKDGEVPSSILRAGASSIGRSNLLSAMTQYVEAKVDDSGERRRLLRAGLDMVKGNHDA